MKICSKCQIEKIELNFSQSQLIKTSGICRECMSIKNKIDYANNQNKKQEYNKKYYEEHREDILENKKIYYEDNRGELAEHQKLYQQNNQESIAEYQKQYRLNNKEDIKIHKEEYYQENKTNIIAQHSQYQKNRYIIDPVFRLRKTVSRQVNLMLRSQGGSKNGKSALKYFPWTPEQLKVYIESQFSLSESLDENGNVWMTWENQGVYRKNGKRTWNLDHKIPQSDLPYDSMDHPNFKICWALENLRPLDAKQNIMDGATRVRHKKKDIK